MTIEEKHRNRRGYVRVSFLGLIAMPAAAFTMVAYGIDVSQLSGIFGTSSATLGAIVIGHLATTPKDDSKGK